MEIQTIAIDIAYLVLCVIVLILGKIVKDILTPYKIDQELSQKDNPALGLALTGYFAAIVIIFIGAVIGPDWQTEITAKATLITMGIDLLYAFGGIIALNIGCLVVDKIILPKFSTRKEIIQDRNSGTGAVECGSYIATALVVAGSISGQGGGPLTALAFFAIGQLALVIFAGLYQVITKYDIHEEIEKDNVSAGVALGLNLIAIGIIAMKAVAGNFESWAVNLKWFAIYAVVGMVMLTILRKVTDALFLPGTTIYHEIKNDQNLNAAMIEGIIAIGISTAFFFIL